MKYFICFLVFLSSLQGDAFERALTFVDQKEYHQASLQLQDAAESGNPAALFGKALCEIASGNLEMTSEHLYEISCASCEKDNSPDLKSETNPVAAYDCRQRVRKVTMHLRDLVEKIVAHKVPGVIEKIKVFRQLNPFIDQLERNALICCQNNESADSCAEPLVEQLNLWNSEGLPTTK